MSFEDGKPWKVNATWNKEMLQDLEAFKGIDAEAELTKILNDEINAVGVSKWVELLVREMKLSPEHRCASNIRSQATVYWEWNAAAREYAAKVFEREYGPDMKAEAVFTMENLFHEIRGTITGKKTGIL